MANRPVKLRFKYGKEGLEAYIARNKRFYGFCSINKCKRTDDQHPQYYYIQMLIPGGWMDFTYECDPVGSVREAKANARKIVEQIVADFQGIQLLPP